MFLHTLSHSMTASLFVHETPRGIHRRCSSPSKSHHEFPTQDVIYFRMSRNAEHILDERYPRRFPSVLRPPSSPPNKKPSGRTPDPPPPPLPHQTSPTSPPSPVPHPPSPAPPARAEKSRNQRADSIAGYLSNPMCPTSNHPSPPLSKKKDKKKKKPQKLNEKKKTHPFSPPHPVMYTFFPALA